MSQSTNNQAKDSVQPAQANGEIRPYGKNPMYWQYKGKPALLLGGTEDDNLFQWTNPRLADHLDTLKDVGGNYVRNTMSSRHHAFPNYSDEGMAYPYKRRSDGRYDLDEWEPEYWGRLQTFLNETRKREIIVQHELWDIATVVCPGAWARSPFNPDNNINYTCTNTSLGEGKKRSGNFFSAVPALNNDTTLLHHQNTYIAKMLDLCLAYDHVLYQLNNENSLTFEASDYWAAFVHKAAAAKGKRAYLCDSRNFHPVPWQHFPYPGFRTLDNPEHAHALSKRKLFNYTDISQNGGNVGEEHYQNLLWFRSVVKRGQPRPVNHTKTYKCIWPTGVPFGERQPGNDLVGGRRFWRTVFGGAASVRHHRRVAYSEAHGGLGLSEIGQRHIRSMRMLTDAVDLFTMEPRNAVLPGRRPNQAFALASDATYAVYFTGAVDGDVSIDLSGVSGSLTERWLDIENCAWRSDRTAHGGGVHNLRVPGAGQWAALLSG